MGFLFPGKEQFYTTECMAGVFDFLQSGISGTSGFRKMGMDGNDKNVGFTGKTGRNVNGRTIKEAARFYP